MGGALINLSHKLNYKKTIAMLFAIVLISTAIFLTYGLTESNIGFFLPRRFKKICAMLLSSYCIGYTSVTFQTITNNRILTPSVMGFDSLYLFLQTVVVFFFGSRSIVMLTGTSNYFISIGFMIISSCLLFYLLFKREGQNLYFVILVGIIFGGFFNGISTFMQVLLDPNEFYVLEGKMFASFNTVNEKLFLVSVIITVIVTILTINDYPDLDALSLGKDLAINLGINYDKVVLKNLIATSVLVSVTTALTGPIIFLGILVASLSRELVGTYKHTWRVLGAFLIGSALLIIGQFFVEKIFKFSLTVSTVINFIGGLYFIYLISKEAKR